VIRVQLIQIPPVRTVVQRVRRAVAVDVGIAGVAEPVVVHVGLVGVRNRGTVVADVAHAVAATHVGLTDEQRAGFVRYFEGANGLDVTLSDVDVLVDGDQALVTFTRHDTFRDAQSGKEMRLEVRLSSVAEQRDGRWLLRGVKRSS